MSDEHNADEQLMRYFDGELSESEAAAFAQRLEADPELRAKHNALGNLNKAIGASTDEVSAGVDFDALYSRIETSIQQEAAAISDRAPAPGLMERLGQWWRGLAEHPSQLWVPAAGLAAAAAVFFVVSETGPGGAGTADGPNAAPG
ncbi:MAG: hypothetical protein OXT09_18665, partial [Myxococcales bacterium]|nr:hypothetical protein [Myxococcales bacterium]